MPRTHNLKCWPASFAAIVAKRKRFEWRKDDGRDFAVGDLLHLNEYDLHADVVEKHRYTGRFCVVRVTYILRGAHEMPSGFCVMSIRLQSIGGVDRPTGA